MFDILLLQTQAEAFINSIWALFLAISLIFGTLAAVAFKIATRVRDRLKDSKNENHQKLVAVIDDYILPTLDIAGDFIGKTREQEEKIKEGMEIVYNFMGPEADKITEKPKVKIDKLTKDVQDANTKAEEYRIKLERLMEIMDELKANPEIKVRPSLATTRSKATIIKK